jgi:hypothetical protein
LLQRSNAAANYSRFCQKSCGRLTLRLAIWRSEHGCLTALAPAMAAHPPIKKSADNTDHLETALHKSDSLQQE